MDAHRKHSMYAGMVAGELPPVAPGQIWRELDPRNKVPRLVKVIELVGEQDVRIVTKRPSGLLGRVSCVLMRRFNGERSNYGYFPEDNTNV